MFGFSWTKVLRVSSTSGSSWYWSLLYLSSAWLHHHHQHHPDQFALMQLDIYTISLNIPGCSMLVWKMSKAWHRPVARCGQTQKTTINNMNQPETVDTNTKHINCVIRPDTQHILMFKNNCNFYHRTLPFSHLTLLLTLPQLILSTQTHMRLTPLI